MSFVKDFDGRRSLEHEIWDERSWTEWYDMLDEFADEPLQVLEQVAVQASAWISKENA